MNVPASSAQLTEYRVSPDLPGVTQCTFHVQQNIPTATADDAIAAIAAAVDNKLSIVRSSLKRFTLDPYSFAATAVLVARDDVQEVSRVPGNFQAIAKNMYMSLDDQKMYDAEAVAGGKIRLTRRSDLESVEAIAALLEGRKRPLRATASRTVMQATASVASLGRGVMTSYIDPADMQLQLGFVIDAYADNGITQPNIGNTQVAVASMSKQQLVPLRMPAFMLVEQISASRFVDALRMPAQAAVASAAPEDQMSYYNTLGQLNSEMFDRWLEICRERNISIPMME